MVKVYRLITANTYERDMFDKASLKLGLDKAVLQSMTPKDNQQPLSRKEVEDLLRKGAYGAVMDENDEGNKFNEEDIETILQRRTQTVRLEVGFKSLHIFFILMWKLIVSYLKYTFHSVILLFELTARHKRINLCKGIIFFK
jgi:hypothetical protein